MRVVGGDLAAAPRLLVGSDPERSGVWGVCYVLGGGGGTRYDTGQSKLQGNGTLGTVTLGKDGVEAQSRPTLARAALPRRTAEASGHDPRQQWPPREG